MLIKNWVSSWSKSWNYIL